MEKGRERVKVLRRIRQGFEKRTLPMAHFFLQNALGWCTKLQKPHPLLEILLFCLKFTLKGRRWIRQRRRSKIPLIESISQHLQPIYRFIECQREVREEVESGYRAAEKNILALQRWSAGGGKSRWPTRRIKQIEVEKK